jgi:hypothetical protein
LLAIADSRTVEMTWSETDDKQVYMKEESLKQNSCFALKSIDLFGST